MERRGVRSVASGALTPRRWCTHWIAFHSFRKPERRVLLAPYYRRESRGSGRLHSKLSRCCVMEANHTRAIGTSKHMLNEPVNEWMRQFQEKGYQHHLLLQAATNDGNWKRKKKRKKVGGFGN